VNRVEPAVVNISTTQVMEKKPAAKKRRAPQQDDQQQDDPMQDFFDRFFDGRGDAPPRRNAASAPALSSISAASFLRTTT